MGFKDGVRDLSRETLTSFNMTSRRKGFGRCYHHERVVETFSVRVGESIIACTETIKVCKYPLLTKDYI